MMREMFERRFGRAAREDPDRDSGEWPDLVLIDGGKGQLSAARGILEDLGIEDVCMIGVAKGPHHGREGREVFHLMDGREITFPLTHPVLFYLQRLRDEAHRFSLSHHRKRRSAAALHSALDDIPGVGPATRRKLMGEFGTVDAIKAAGEDALLQVVNLRVAQAIRSWAANQKD